jgi:hypothetical protein
MDALAKSSADLGSFFPPKLVGAMFRVADARSIPHAQMVTNMLLLAATFSPSSWANGVEGQTEPLILHLKAMGASGINKSGGTQLFDSVFKQVRSTLVALATDSDTCLEEGVRIDRQSIPELDHTGTQAALIKKNSAHRNLTANHDEFATAKRQATNGAGGGGSSESGFQHHLVSYNGPTKITNELKGSLEVIFTPRLNTAASIQPQFARSDFGEGTPLFNLGLTSRSLWFSLQSNFSPDEIRPGVNKDEQSLLEFALAIAARGCVVTGQWLECENSSELESKFVGKGNPPLTSLEEAALAFTTNRFESNGLGGHGADWKEGISVVRRLNQVSEYERAKAANKGEEVAGRFAETYEFTSGDDGSESMLPVDLVASGIEKLRVFRCKDGSEAQKALEEIVLRQQKSLASRKEESALKNIEGKTGGHFIRLMGLSQTIETAVGDVADILNDTALTDVSSMKGFLLNVVQREGEKHAEMGAQSYQSWAPGTELESRLPIQYFEEVSFESVTRASNLLATSQQVAGSLLKSSIDASTSPIKSGGPAARSPTAADPSSLASFSASSLAAGSDGKHQSNFSRTGEIVQIACTTKFVKALVTNIVPSLRLRASNKGSNPGPSETSLLKSVQDSGLVAIAVHGTSSNKKLYFQKKNVDDLSVSQKKELAGALSKFGVTLDEYRANAKPGHHDVSLSAAGDHLQGTLPYNLCTSDTPSLLQDMARSLVEKEAVATLSTGAAAATANASGGSSSSGATSASTPTMTTTTALLVAAAPVTAAGDAPVLTQVRGMASGNGSIDDGEQLASTPEDGDEGLRLTAMSSSASSSSSGTAQVLTQLGNDDSEVNCMDDGDDAGGASDTSSDNEGQKSKKPRS